MRLLIGGMALAFAGLTLLLAQATRALDPSLALSLLAFAATFGGMLVGIAGVIRGFRGHR
ncbi:hypothetical protein [Thioalkalivibrio paradoxus]|uniref:Uncharacterized protein n=1 Tax=Thioalkalivibrio paradoxus ARh 1 TaxID=713585 RepID=W0DSU5_9GAMM|nr:hypothetical protein [Thioalkalivibrio paradoxus]AHE99940.1 hypothetical protein THITH_04470 [Thioalkalivibrio paradoxus ARh 1]